MQTSHVRSLTHAFTSFKLLAAGCLLIWMAACSCSGEIIIRIGDFDSNDAALRASIPKLADAIRKCPHAKIYRIVYTAPGIYGEPGTNTVYRHALLYSRRDRQKAAIGYEDDVFSGFKPEPARKRLTTQLLTQWRKRAGHSRTSRNMIAGRSEPSQTGR